MMEDRNLHAELLSANFFSLQHSRYLSDMVGYRARMPSLTADPVLRQLKVKQNRWQSAMQQTTATA